MCPEQVEEYGDEVFERLSKGGHIYFCGLKGMMPGILTMLESVAEKKKLVWEDFLKGLKSNGEWTTGTQPTWVTMFLHAWLARYTARDNGLGWN